MTPRKGRKLPSRATMAARFNWWWCDARGRCDNGIAAAKGWPDTLGLLTPVPPPPALPLPLPEPYLRAAWFYELERRIQPRPGLDVPFSNLSLPQMGSERWRFMDAKQHDEEGEVYGPHVREDPGPPGQPGPMFPELTGQWQFTRQVAFQFNLLHTNKRLLAHVESWINEERARRRMPDEASKSKGRKNSQRTWAWVELFDWRSAGAVLSKPETGMVAKARKLLARWKLENE